LYTLRVRGIFRFFNEIIIIHKKNGNGVEENETL